MKESWWLMYSSFPDLNWARMRVFSNGESAILDMDGKTHLFKSQEEAKLWLLEDEFIKFSSLDSDDEKEYGITLSLISTPSGDSEQEIISKMYVRKNA